ncbi:unnamed protein product [Leptosia nina]|uniref:UDP-glucuronosyltransferase n=1 Tax=Leptosia nina TaxID=320188 RepID=A0AAV1JET0_9NEOP
MLLKLSLIFFFISRIDAARILAVFPTPSISHQQAFRPIIQELVKRNHDVYVLTTDPMYPKNKAPANLTEIDVHDLSYQEVAGWLQDVQGDKLGIIKTVKDIFARIIVLLEKQIQVPEFKELYGQKFDLLLIEAYVQSALVLAHVFDAPVIQVSSLGGGPKSYAEFGAPYHPLLFPSAAAQRLYNLTMFEKAQSLLINYFLEYLVLQSREFEYEMWKRNFGPDVPTYDELFLKKVQMLFLNEHPIWSDNHPVPPSIVYIGGIHQPLEPEMPQELQTFLDSSKNGVIYISFGSNVKPSILPPEKIQVMTKVLSKLRYDVLWKWDQEELPGKSENIRIYKWFPQPTLLKHPKVKIFITQGGLQSTDEAIDAAVPLIGIPMLGDQWYNVEKYVRHDIGLQLDINHITEDSFRNAIERVIDDKRYKENIIRLRSIMREYPIEPKKLAVWWIEHVLKHGGKHLRSPATGLTFFEYYEVPLLLTMLGISILVVAAIVFTILIVWRQLKKRLTSSGKKKQKKQKKL